MKATLIAVMAFNPAWAGPAYSCAPFAQAEPESRPADGSTKWLSELWTIGRPESSIYDASPFGVSPDGTMIALIARRARPQTNDYCQRLLVIDLKRPNMQRDLGDVGPPVFTEIDNLRGSVFPTGLFKPVAPLWSPDGKQIAFLRRAGDQDQAAVVRAADGSLELTTRLEAGVESVRWSLDGRALILGSRAGLARKRAAIEMEARSGFRFDARFIPNSSTRPFPTGPNPVTFYRLPVAGAPNAPLSPAEPVELLRKPQGIPEAAVLHAANGNDARAWVSQDTPELYPSTKSLWVAIGGASLKCAFAACRSGVVGIWWSRDGEQLWFLRKGGRGDSEISLYTWRVGVAEPKMVLSTTDVIAGCQPVSDRLLCAREGTVRPRYLELIDPTTGASQLVFEPNMMTGLPADIRVHRLHWKTKIGSPAFGDLVYREQPFDQRKHPLIVVQYDTKGFLRGGTGDEIPIFPLVMRGFAILSVQRPASFAEGLGRQWKNWQDAEVENTKGWRDRRNTVDSLITAVRIATSYPMIDAKRVGITGLSDGASTAISSLVTTKLFSTAVLGTCCSDPVTFGLLGGSAWSEALRRYGYPERGKGGPQFWKEISLAINAKRIRAPVLMQLSDDEYQLGLEAFSALKGEGRAVDMIVFPGERHIKWQPAHRLAVYNRAVAWLSFWLKDETAPEASPEEIGHWADLKKRLENPG